MCVAINNVTYYLVLTKGEEVKANEFNYVQYTAFDSLLLSKLFEVSRKPQLYR